MQHVQDDLYRMYHLHANANTKTSLHPAVSLSLSHLLQYTTDLDYSELYDYSEGATDIISPDENSEPQVNEKKEKEMSLCVVRPCASQCCVHAHPYSH